MRILVVDDNADPLDRLETQIAGVVIFYSLVAWQKLDNKKQRNVFQKYFTHKK